MNTRKRQTMRMMAALLILVVTFSLTQVIPVQAAVETVKMDPASVTMLKGEQIRHSIGIRHNLSAKSSKPSVVQVETRDKDVLLKAKKTGTATITIVDENYLKTEKYVYTYKVTVVKPDIEINYAGMTKLGGLIVSVTNHTKYSFDVSLAYTLRDAKGSKISSGTAYIDKLGEGQTGYGTLLGKLGLKPSYKKSTIEVKEYKYDPKMKYTNATSQVKITEELDLSGITFTEGASDPAYTNYSGTALLNLSVENTGFEEIDGYVDILWYDDEDNLFIVDTQHITLEAGRTWGDGEPLSYKGTKYVNDDEIGQYYHHCVVVPRFRTEEQVADRLAYFWK